jgi:hypothetical protein
VPLAQAVAANCAWPGAFPVVNVGGRRSIDGGIQDGVNAQLATGHDIVLGISCRPLSNDGGMPPATARRLRNTRHAIDELRRPADRPPQGMSLVLVDFHAPGVEGRANPKMGRRAVASCKTTYDNGVSPSPTGVSEEGRGLAHLLDGLSAERILGAAEALGIGRAALRRAVAQANERVGFGRPGCPGSPPSARSSSRRTWPSTGAACLGPAEPVGGRRRGRAQPVPVVAALVPCSALPSRGAQR